MHPQPTIAHVPQHAIVIYIRVSTPKQRDEGYSLDRQRKDAIAEALGEAQRQGHSVPPPEDILCDADTGKTCHRTGRQTLWEWVRRGEVRLVIIPCIDRMGRNTRDSIELKDHLEAHGVRVVLLKERIDTTTSAGNLFFQQMAAWSEYEGRNILERTAGGKAEKRERGEAWATEKGTPYGYKYVKPKNKHTPAYECFPIVPEAADIVRRAIELVAGGMSAHKVAELYTQEGIRTPSGALCWHVTTIAKWIHNTAYEGRLPRNKYEVIREADTPETRGKRKQRIRGDDEIEYLPIRKIVEPETRQRALENLGKGKLRSTRNLKHQYLLWRPRGEAVLFCGKCLQEGRVRQLTGHFHTNSKNGKTYSYTRYRCVYRLPSARKGNHHVGCQKLDDALWAELCSILAEPANVLADIEKLADEASAAAHALEGELATVALEGEDLSLQEDRLIELYQVGTLTKEKLEARAATLRDRIEERKVREAELRLQHKAACNQMIPVRDIEEACALVWEWIGQDPPFEVKQKVVRALITRVVAWLDDPDGEGKQCATHKKLHFHMEGKLPSIQADEGAISAFVDTASQCWGRGS
jgi:site-specific DNA recombinase